MWALTALLAPVAALLVAWLAAVYLQRLRYQLHGWNGAPTRCARAQPRAECSRAVVCKLGPTYSPQHCLGHAGGGCSVPVAHCLCSPLSAQAPCRCRFWATFT